FDFDAEKLLQTFREKFGGKWRLFVRLHPCMNDVDKVINFNKLLMTNLTNYSDVQELLHISDILITDYSSVMFDFMLTRRPCFLFATDVDTYDRGTYIDINKLPFPLAENNRELIQNVENFDESIYLSDLQQFENYVLQSFENGTAAFKVADYIAEIISN
ncbi:MAG: CDP-glycerol glycerophosphotransferase family protein, partial [Prevotellaceae bacterium]|nr:CDP-glycerol glycerophosphotransferase family protein [Prevotellaceae bacterium]